jgi:tRNA G18 (ribose-2'-O)-methylase SpoU
MRRHVEHRQQGIFVAEGEKVVRRLLESDFTVVSALMPRKWFDDLEPVLRAREEQIQVFIADKKLLESLTGFSMYQGLLAVGQIPPAPTLDQVLNQSPKPVLLVAVDGLSSAENVGSVVRNCVAFGVHGILIGETSSSPFLRRAVRSSMGGVFLLPVFESSNLAETLAELKRNGIHCVAAHPHANGRTITGAMLSMGCCLVLGSEGYGISDAVLKECDEQAAIPMAPKVDSLNVANAAAVFLYEANRQRGRM